MRRCRESIDPSRTIAAVSTLLALFAIAGCGNKQSPQTATPAPSNEAYGDIVSYDAVTDLPPALGDVTGWAQKFTYLSRSGINDSTTRVSGTLLVPRGAPPDGGWRFVAYGHPSTGSLPGCAPPLEDAAPAVGQLLQAGFAVTLSDYQGLGNPDQSNDSRKRDVYHPYLDSTTAGYNLIDSVRAARALMATSHTAASDNWLAFGIGQGGQAAWAANELAANQAKDMKLLGTVAVSPVADMDGLADLADAGTLNTQQTLDLQAFLAGVHNAYGAEFNLDDYRSGIVQQKWDDLLACQGPALDERAAVASQIAPGDLKPHSPDAAATLRGFLQKTSLPQGPTQAPMMVVYGGQDPLIPPDWTAAAIGQACKMGDVIHIQRMPADAPSDQFDMAAAVDWMNQRVSGAPAQNDCGGAS